jgi:hypothetical protein
MLSHTASAWIVLTAILIAAAFFYLLANDTRLVTDTGTPTGTHTGTSTIKPPDSTEPEVTKEATNYTLMYIGITVAIVVVLVGLFLLRRLTKSSRLAADPERRSLSLEEYVGHPQETLDWAEEKSVKKSRLARQETARLEEEIRQTASKLQPTRGTYDENEEGLGDPAASQTLYLRQLKRSEG